MKILVLGASGLVGGNCVKVFAENGWEVVGTHFSFKTKATVYFNTLDLKDSKNFNVAKFLPDAIVHCGAMTHVDYCEDHEEESYQKTVQSTRNVVLLAKQFNARLVYLSTDYVFDGKKGFYSEMEITNPLSIYARHKLEAELMVRNSENHLVCRITNVYGREIRGKNFVVRLVENMLKNTKIELTLPIDQYASPVNAIDIGRAIYHLLKDNKHGVYHLASTDYLNRVQLAERVMHYFGHSGVKLNPVTSKELNQPAKRPLLGGFNASKFNSEYPDFGWSNVDDFLIEYAANYRKTQRAKTKDE